MAKGIRENDSGRARGDGAKVSGGSKWSAADYRLCSE